MVNKQNEPICWSSMDFKMTSRRLEKQSQKLIFNQFVLISWVEPSDNSAFVDADDIFIANSAGIFTQDLTYCNGANSVIKSQLSCEIPMSVLRSALCSLPFNVVVQTTVSTHNYFDGVGSQTITPMVRELNLKRTRLLDSRRILLQLMSGWFNLLGHPLPL